MSRPLTSLIRFMRKHSDERGALMLEAIALLGLMTMMSPMLVKQTSEKTQEVEEVTIAGQMKMLRDAAMSYIDANLGNLGDTSATGAFGAGYTGADGEKQSIVLNNRDLAAFLPPGFCLEENGECVFQNRLVDNYRASVVRQHSCDNRDGSGNRTDECKPFDYTVLIVSGPRTGGGATDEIADRRAMRIAAMIGADGGFIPSEKVANVSGNSAQISVLGAQGIWEIPNVNDFFPADSAWRPGRGQVAVTTVYKGNATLGEFLYRKQTAVEGGNAMFTDLDMGGQVGMPNDEDGTVTDPLYGRGTPHDIKGVKGLFVDSEGGLYVRDLPRNTTLPGDANFTSYNAATQASLMPRAQFTRNTMSTGDSAARTANSGISVSRYSGKNIEHRIRHNLNSAGMEAAGETSIVHQDMAVVESGIKNPTGDWSGYLDNYVSSDLRIKSPSYSYAANGKRIVRNSDVYKEEVGLAFNSSKAFVSSLYTSNAALQVMASTPYLEKQNLMTGNSVTIASNQRNLIKAYGRTGLDSSSGNYADVKLEMSSSRPYAYQSFSDAGSLTSTSLNETRLFGSVNLSTSSVIGNTSYLSGMAIKPYNLYYDEAMKMPVSANSLTAAQMSNSPSLVLERRFERPFGTGTGRYMVRSTGMEMGQAALASANSIDRVRLYSMNVYGNSTRLVSTGGYLDIAPAVYTFNTSRETNVSDPRISLEGRFLTSTPTAMSMYYSGMESITSSRDPDMGYDQTGVLSGRIGGGLLSVAGSAVPLRRENAMKSRNYYKNISTITSINDKFAGLEYSQMKEDYAPLSADRTDFSTAPMQAGLQTRSFSKGANVTNSSHDTEAFINTLTGDFTTYGEQVVDWSTFDVPSTSGESTYASNTARRDRLSGLVGNSGRTLSRISMGTKDTYDGFDSEEGTAYMMTSLNMEPIAYGANSNIMYAPSARLRASLNGEFSAGEENTVESELKMYAYNKNPKADLYVRKTGWEALNGVYSGNSFGGWGQSFESDFEAKGGLETAITEYNQAEMKRLYGTANGGKVLNSSVPMREVRTRLSAMYDEDTGRQRFRTAPYFDAQGNVIPEAANSAKYLGNLAYSANETWNAGEAQLDLSNFSNLLKDSGDAFEYHRMDLTDNAHPAITPFAPQATLSAVSSDADLLQRLNDTMPPEYFLYAREPHDTSFDTLTKAAQLKLRSTSLRRRGDSAAFYTHIPSARLDAVMAREDVNWGRGLREGSSLVMDAMTSGNSSLPQLQSSLSTERTYYEQYSDAFRNPEDWVKGRLTTSDLWSSEDQTIYRTEKTALNMVAGQDGPSTASLPQARGDFSSRVSGNNELSQTFMARSSLNMYADSDYVNGSFTGHISENGVGYSGMAFNASRFSSQASVFSVPSGAATSMPTHSTANISGFFTKTWNPAVNSTRFINPDDNFGALKIRGNSVEAGWHYAGSITNTATNFSGGANATANSFPRVSFNSTATGYHRYGVRSKITGGLMVGAPVGTAPVAEITATYVNGSTFSPNHMYGRLLLGRGSSSSTNVGIDLDTRYWKIMDGYIEMTGSQRDGGAYAPLMAYSMPSITYNSYSTSVESKITVSSSVGSSNVVNGTFSGQLKQISNPGTGYYASTGFPNYQSGSTFDRNAPAASMFRDQNKDNYRVIYNKFRLDPAYVSVMNDIKLTSRGGANLSDILPNYVLKSIYTLSNQYAKGPWPCQITDQNSNIITITSYSQKYNYEDANPGNCSFVIPRGRLSYRKSISGSGYGDLINAWENDCSFMNTLGGGNYCLSDWNEGNGEHSRSLYVSYAASNYINCADTGNPMRCLTHPYMGSVPAPGMVVKVNGKVYDDREAGMCPAGYMPVMTVTPSAFDVGKVIFVDVGTSGETYDGPATTLAHNMYVDDLAYVPYHVYDSYWYSYNGASSWMARPTSVNSGYANITESHRFYNFGHQDFRRDVPSIYQPATRIAVAAKPLCSTSLSSCKSTNWTSTMMASSSYDCSSSRPVLCGWAVAMGTVTPNKVKTNAATSPDYFWNMGGIFQNTMQAIVHTYCYFNPQNFYFPNMGYDSDRGTLRPLDNPSLLYNGEYNIMP